MRFHRFLSAAPVLALTFSPCFLPWQAAAADTEPPAPSFSVTYMDPTVDPRVDFARYAAGNWYKTTEIPADKSAWGSFNQLE